MLRPFQEGEPRWTDTWLWTTLTRISVLQGIIRVSATCYFASDGFRITYRPPSFCLVLQGFHSILHAIPGVGQLPVPSEVLVFALFIRVLVKWDFRSHSGLCIPRRILTILKSSGFLMICGFLWPLILAHFTKVYKGSDKVSAFLKYTDFSRVCF